MNEKLVCECCGIEVNENNFGYENKRHGYVVCEACNTSEKTTYNESSYFGDNHGH
jgi:hypothetical protein